MFKQKQKKPLHTIYSQKKKKNVSKNHKNTVFFYLKCAIHDMYMHMNQEITKLQIQK